MNPAEWIDLATVPPRHLPSTIDGALSPTWPQRWVTQSTRTGRSPASNAAMGRWPMPRPRSPRCSSCWWRTTRGRGLGARPAAHRRRRAGAKPGNGPDPAAAHTHRRRFQKSAIQPPASRASTPATVAPWLATQDARTLAWLARAGRFAQPDALTNTLGARDDAQALALFLRDRAGRSAHNPAHLRHRTAPPDRLIAWCEVQGHGPLSDLTRQHLLAYRHALQQGDGHSEDTLPPLRPLADTTRTRALAVVASLYRYWYDTGYLHANPAASLSAGSRARAGFTPTRLLPPALLAACDAWCAVPISEADDALAALRRRAIWALFRYAGVRRRNWRGRPRRACRAWRPKRRSTGPCTCTARVTSVAPFHCRRPAWPSCAPIGSRVACRPSRPCTKHCR